MSDTHEQAALIEPAEHEGHGLGHAVPLGVLAGVFVTLGVLTILTVAVTWVDLGELNVWIALAIATVKASLVVLYFMHLRYDHPFNALVFLIGLLFLALFVSSILVDTFQYQPNIQNW